MADDTLYLKPAVVVVSALVLGLLVFLAANGAIALFGDGPAGQPADGNGTAGQAAPKKLPATFGGLKWYEQDLREQGWAYRNATAGSKVQFQPKEMNNQTLPENEHRRELVKYGRELFANTSGLMPNYTGTTRLSCANCHGGGSLPTTQGMVGQDIDMIPLVGTAAGYPEWTGRTQRMRDMRQRITGCFLRSMDAANSEKGVPAYDSREIQAMEVYMEWLGKGTPVGRVPYWRHIEKPEGEEKVPVPEVNPVRGAELYLQHCASCHGKDGQGTVGQYPPLWGPDSYNDGAGMGRVYTSAGFVREAMPYGYAHTLSDWDKVHDIAGFMNAHKRPHLPRQPKDWAVSGAPDEGIYYKRVQQRFGYEMNPMTKKLLIAGVPIDTDPVNESVIPSDVDRYDKPLRNVSVEGDWRTTWLNRSNTYENWTHAGEAGDPPVRRPEDSNGTSTSGTESLAPRGALADAMASEASGAG